MSVALYEKAVRGDYGALGMGGTGESPRAARCRLAFARRLAERVHARTFAERSAPFRLIEKFQFIEAFPDAVGSCPPFAGGQLFRLHEGPALQCR